MRAHILSAGKTVAASLVARLAGALTLVAIAGWFGISADTDAYFIGLSVAGLIAGVGVGFLSTVLLPRLMATGRNPANDIPFVLAATYRVAAWVAGLSLLASSCYWATGESETGGMVLYAIPFAVMLVHTQSMATLLAARGALPVATLTGVITPLATLTTAWLLHDSMGAKSLMLGHAFGAFLEAWLLLRYAERKFYTKGMLSIEAIRQLWATTGADLAQSRMVVLSLTVSACAGLVDLLLFHMAGPQAASVYSYAAKVSAVMAGLAESVAMATAIPVLVALAANRDSNLLAKAKKYALLLAGVLLLSCAVVAALSADIVRLLYLRGQFTEADVTAASSVLAVLVFYLPLSIAGALAARVLNATSWHVLVTRSAVALVLAKLTVGVLLVPSLGALGVSVSWVAGYIVSALVLYYYLNTRLRDHRITVATRDTPVSQN